MWNQAQMLSIQQCKASKGWRLQLAVEHDLSNDKNVGNFTHTEVKYVIFYTPHIHKTLNTYHHS